jgi:hypothetical protein
MRKSLDDIVEVELDLELLIENESPRVKDGKGEALWQCSEECSDRRNGSGRRMLRAATDVWWMSTWSKCV